MDPRAYKYNEPASAVTETKDEWREERVVCCQVKTAMNLFAFHNNGSNSHHLHQTRKQGGGVWTVGS